MQRETPLAMPNSSDKSVAILAVMMFLVAAVGVPSELMLQDTLKSALVAFGVLGAALLFFWQQRQRAAPLQWHGLVWLPLILMVYALGSMAWSHAYLAGAEAIRWFIFALLLWLGLNVLTPKNVPMLLWGIHGGAVIASMWAAFQFWLDLDWFPQGRNPASTFINRNFFAEYLVCTLPFSVFLLTTIRKSAWLPWLAGSIALNMVALMMTGTRSALVAMVVLLPVFVVILTRYRKQFAWPCWTGAERVLVGLVLVAGVGTLGSIPTGSAKVIEEGRGITAVQRSLSRTVSLTDAKEYTERSFYIRSLMWKATARMVMSNPWTGVGAGAWEVQIPLYQRVADTMETDYYPHNEFLQLFSEYGVVVGGLVVAVLFAYWLLEAGTTWRLRDAGLQEAPLRALTLSSLLALAIVSNAGFPWHLAGTTALFAACLAILGGSDVRLGNHSPFFAAHLAWPSKARQAAVVVLLCCTGLAVYITEQAARAEYKLVRAIHIANGLIKSREADDQQWADRKAQMLQSVREGTAINPHYRKLIAELAEPLAGAGDWGNAIWILDSVVASRPNITAIWAGLAMGYSQLGQHDRAQLAFQQVQRLKPGAVPTHTLEVILLNRAGHTDQAIDKLNAYFDQGLFDYDMVQTGYAIGYQTHHWPVAIRSQELRVVTWPEHAADGYLRLGKIYSEPEVQDDAKALAAFRAGLDAVPAEQKDNYRNQIPLSYRMRMQ
jgi:O-antigen ligase